MPKATRNERYRLATQLREGMEVEMRDRTWARVTSHMYITAPLRVVSVEIEGHGRRSFAPRDQVMSRVPEEGRSDAPQTEATR